MSQWLTIDEFHIAFAMPKTATTQSVAKAVRTLQGRVFRNRLQLALRQAAQRFHTLNATRITLAR